MIVTWITARNFYFIFSAEVSLIKHSSLDTVIECVCFMARKSLGVVRDKKEERMIRRGHYVILFVSKKWKGAKGSLHDVKHNVVICLQTPIVIYSNYIWKQWK